MEKLIDRAKDRFTGMAAQIESTLKDIRYNAGMVARTVAKLVKGVLNGQHRP